MLRTIKITVTAVSMVNPCAVPRSKSVAPCTVEQDVHPATSCSYGGGILLQLRSDWVVNIAHSRKHHTRAEHAVLLCTYGRGLGFRHQANMIAWWQRLDAGLQSSSPQRYARGLLRVSSGTVLRVACSGSVCWLPPAQVAYFTGLRVPHAGAVSLKH